MTEQNFSVMRHAMVVSQLRTNGISAPHIVAAIEAVPREDFVPTDRRALAYADMPIVLGSGRSLNSPLATARLIVEAALRPTDCVLLIGAATGYAAAILSRLCETIIAVESDPVLIKMARAALRDYANITLFTGPLAQGSNQNAPYDVIFIDGAIETVPPALEKQCREGGRIVAIIADNGVTRFVSGYKMNGKITLLPFAEGGSVALPGFSRAKEFSF